MKFAEELNIRFFDRKWCHILILDNFVCILPMQRQVDDFFSIISSIAYKSAQLTWDFYRHFIIQTLGFVTQ